MSGRLARILLCTAVLAIAAPPAHGQPGQPGNQPGYFEVVSRSPGALELRFHNMPMRAVHADDSQNALAVDFQGQVDGTAFDRLPVEFPDWVMMAYANFDSGVIRATRPVTFLTRQESDGFSLRIVPRAGAAAAPPPVALRGQADAGPPPPPPGQEPPPPPSGRYGGYGPMRNYAATELALRGSDDVWTNVYARSAAESDSDFSIGGEYHGYHNGDRIIASQAHMRIALGGGLSLIGSVYDTDAHADAVRAPDGSIATGHHDNLVTGAGGFSFETGDNTGLTLEALEGNNITGARFTAFTGDPEQFYSLGLSWHDSGRDTPEAILNRGLKDQAVIAAGFHIGYGLWTAFDGRFTNYGVHGNASVAKTAGWDGNLHWNLDLGGLYAGLAYDGHGEYLLDNASYVGAPPSPYVPLGIRDMETHAFTGSLSSQLDDAFWFDVYGGYIRDRYASEGAIYGAALRFHPMPGVNVALGARHSNVSLMQGEIGPETSAGLTFTLGFDSPAMSDYF